MLPHAILIAGVVSLMLAGHITWRVSRGWRVASDIAMAVVLAWTGVQLIGLHSRLTNDPPTTSPPAEIKKWERAI